MKLSLLFLLQSLGCAAEPEMSYSREGAMGVTDGPPTQPSGDPSDTGDTEDTGDTGD